MDERTLDNVFWLCLSGPHAHFSAGTGTARRYLPGLSPIAAFATPRTPDLDALIPHCTPDERFYVDGWSGPCPRTWQIHADTTMFKMIWDRPMPEHDPAPDAVALAPEHARRALELATLTKPGPFGLRTIELGEYFGLFDGERLMAMAGERTCADGLREISGVCTHPDHRGRGLSKRLMAKLIRRQMLRGERPFLHVASANAGARTLYRDMGFRECRESPLRIVSRSP